MWEIVKDKLLWSLIILLISSWISYRISRHMLKKNLKSNLYIDELKEIRDLLKVSLKDMEEKEPIFMVLKEYGYTESISFENIINTLGLDDKKLTLLLRSYSTIVKEYNRGYFEWNKNNLNEYGEPKIDTEDRDKQLVKYKSQMNVLYKEINRRIEIIIT